MRLGDQTLPATVFLLRRLRQTQAGADHADRSIGALPSADQAADWKKLDRSKNEAEHEPPAGPRERQARESRAGGEATKPDRAEMHRTDSGTVIVATHNDEPPDAQ
jgi:hypothetical protein